MRTSGGTLPSSMISRTKSKSVWLAAGNLDQQFEHAALAGGRHRVDQRLVAVAQVDGAPQGRRGDPLVGPGAVGQRDRLDLLLERAVPVHRHAAAELVVPDGLLLRRGPGGCVDTAGGRGLVAAGTDVHRAQLLRAERTSTGGDTELRDREPVWSDPVAAAKQKATCHDGHSSHTSALRPTPGRSSGARPHEPDAQIAPFAAV
jgi:hypothetical protein